MIVELTPTGREIAESTPMGGIVLLRRRLPALDQERRLRMNEALSDLIALMDVQEVE